MNDQEKRDLMLEMTILSQGEWRSDKCHPRFFVNTCVDKAWLDLGFPNGHKFICTKQEFEDFVESLFYGAPDDAEYYLRREDSYDFWKSVAGGYLHWNKATQGWHNQVCSLSQVESELISRPRKQNWTPKAGEPCEFDVGGGDWVYALPLFVGKTVIVFENDHGDECRATSIDRFRPAQTKTEKERERLIELLANQLGELCPLPEVVNAVIDAGWRPQKATQ